MASRSEKLFKLGVGLYIAGLSGAICSVAVLARVVTVPGNANRLGLIILIFAAGLMAGGWVLRKCTRHS
jgi:hypothetical protein